MGTKWKRSKKNQSLVKQRKRKKALSLLEAELKSGISRGKVISIRHESGNGAIGSEAAPLTESDKKRITKEISNLKAKL